MTVQQQPRLDESFARIEETILPCLTMLLDSMLEAAAGVGESDPKALAAELRTLAAEIEGLTHAVERSSPVREGCAPLQHVA
jgi:hypothetical protein